MVFVDRNRLLSQTFNVLAVPGIAQGEQAAMLRSGNGSDVRLRREYPRRNIVRGGNKILAQLPDIGGISRGLGGRVNGKGKREENEG